jgi:tRNA 2-(methylsulfanyl)-N6-isopentenyladenosine37 hydroxylase
MTDLSPINAFLSCPTPSAWVDWALENEELMLIDHANCEKKAAATAMNLMYRYVDKTELLKKMSQLAREELLHFEQVVTLMQEKGIAYTHISSSRYASSLREHMHTHEPAKLVDTLIVGAFVEARSCERFAKIAPKLDEKLQRFYGSLLRSECRHFEDYLTLARLYQDADISERIAFFAKKEAELIVTPDEEFRFHSGVPV